MAYSAVYKIYCHQRYTNTVLYTHTQKERVPEKSENIIRSTRFGFQSIRRGIGFIRRRFESRGTTPALCAVCFVKTRPADIKDGGGE